MKHFKVLLTVALVALVGAWTFATIEVQTTTPKVNPTGENELVGQMRLVFSAKEFVGAVAPSTEFNVVVRVQLTLDKRLVSVGGQDDYTDFVYIPLVWETDQGAFDLATYTEAESVRIIGFYPGDSTGAGSYLDILFMDDMGNWVFNGIDKIRVTLGGPSAWTATAAPCSTSARCTRSTSSPPPRTWPRRAK